MATCTWGSIHFEMLVQPTEGGIVLPTIEQVVTETWAAGGQRIIQRGPAKRAFRDRRIWVDGSTYDDLVAAAESGDVNDLTGLVGPGGGSVTYQDMEILCSGGQAPEGYVGISQFEITCSFIGI